MLPRQAFIVRPVNFWVSYDNVIDGQRLDKRDKGEGDGA